MEKSWKIQIWKVYLKKSFEKFCKPILFNEDVELLHPVPGSQLIVNLTKEMEQYFTTGNSGLQDDSRARCVNPTLLQLNTGKWLVFYACCPFVGYASLPLKELDQSGEKNRIAFEYCRAELKKLLIAFRKKQQNVTFHFHLCDPLVFCYQDSAQSFDIIEASSCVVDFFGLGNLLTAAPRKLRSDQSVLITESVMWTLSASDVSRHLQTALCCPLSLIPTIYGLNLMDNVEMGPDTFISTRNSPRSFSRLRWKRAQPFEGVVLTMSPQLEQCLERLKKLCFLVKSPSSGSRVGMSCTMLSYSPLTFCYVMCNLICRGGLPATAIENFQPPLVFRTSMEATQAWKEHRPIWRVNACIKLDQDEQAAFDKICSTFLPTVRLILVPNLAFKKASTCENDDKRFLELITSSENHHFFENLELYIKRNSENEEIDQVDISFLLADRNLLKTHSGAVVDREHRFPIFKLGSFATNRHLKVEKFIQPFPCWSQGEEQILTVSTDSSSADRSKKSMAITCKESNDSYTLCINFRSRDQLPQSGRQLPKCIDSDNLAFRFY